MARRRFWFTNRVVLGFVAFFALTAIWEFKWKPQLHSYYEEGVRLYQSGKYQQAQPDAEKPSKKPSPKASPADSRGAVQ
jgi:hypothetical protein